MKIATIVVAALFLSACVTSEAADEKAKYHAHASWYEKGKITASGEKFDPDALTAAHKYLPFGTVLRVTNPKTGKTIDVVVNDRGPFTKGRDLDLSRGSAIELGFFHSGTAKLLIENLSRTERLKNEHTRKLRKHHLRSADEPRRDRLRP